MLEGINDSIKDAKELVKLIKPFKAKINLIPFNPWPGSNYKLLRQIKLKYLKNLFWKKVNWLQQLGCQEEMMYLPLVVN